MALFEAVRLHKRFGARVVLEDISLRFEEGEVSGIMGPNGAGKTTCFNLLTGRHRPDRGDIRFEDRSIAGLSPQRIARLGISRSFQIMSLFDDCSVIENVLVALPAYGERRALEIGVALAARPRLLFLDEPTSGLGAEAIRRLADLIRSLRDRYTIVMIEHDMRFLFELADRISVIHWGQVIAEGTPADLQSNPWVQRSALGAVA